MLEILKDFFKSYSPVIIINTSTDKWLLCLYPEFETHDSHILMKFISLNAHKWGNNVEVCKIHEESEGSTLFFENLEWNILMIQELSLVNYNFYIRDTYTNAPRTNDLEEIKKFINDQLWV